MSKKREQGFGLLAVALVVALAGIISLAGWYVWQKRDDNKAKNIDSFQACADAGYPVQESYPEVCATPDGKSFTNTKIVEPGNSDTQALATVTDKKIEGDIPNPMTVAYLVEHRSALNGKTITVTGEVISVVTPEQACPDNDELGMPCDAPRLVINDPTDDTGGVVSSVYNVEVMSEKSKDYSVGQVVTFTVEVTGDKNSISLYLKQ